LFFTKQGLFFTKQGLFFTKQYSFKEIKKETLRSISVAKTHHFDEGSGSGTHSPAPQYWLLP
jgi:hypothetical protein